MQKFLQLYLSFFLGPGFWHLSYRPNNISCSSITRFHPTADPCLIDIGIRKKWAVAKTYKKFFLYRLTLKQKLPMASKVKKNKVNFKEKMVRVGTDVPECGFKTQPENAFMPGLSRNDGTGDMAILKITAKQP